MNTKLNKSCKYCSKPITAEMIFNSLIICGSCGLASNEEKSSLPLKIAIYGGMAVFALGLMFYLKDPLLLIWDPNYAFKNMSEEKAAESVNKCLQLGDVDCLIAGYRRLDELNPDDIYYRANLAVNLTRKKRYKEADPLYSELIKHEDATYDVFSFYGLNLENLKQPEKAIEMYERALAIEPNVVDITMRLTSLYMKTGRTVEAESLAASFSAKFPKYEAEFEKAVRSKSAPEKNTKSGHLRLVSTDNHFQVPITMSKTSKAKLFVVDTGATTVMMPTSDAQAHFPELMQSAIAMEGSIANGARIRTHMIVVPNLRIGSWDFKNIKVSYCDGCSRLAGMSLLKKMKMQVSSSGDFSSLKLSR